MKQQNQLPFKTFQLLQLQCQITKQYLAGNIQIKQTLFGGQEITSLHLQNDSKDQNTHFIIELQDHLKNEFLYYGDLIAIKHFRSQLYIRIQNDQKCDVYLGDEPEYFVLQPTEVENSSLIKYVNQKIIHPFRLLSSDNRNYIVSLQQKNTQKIQIKGRINLDKQSNQIGIWNFSYCDSTNAILKFYDQVVNKPVFVEDGKKVVIRNWWTGFTLHSHTQISQCSKNQEVTCYSHPRDENDDWSIVKSNSRNTSKFINYDDLIFLQHYKTAQFLNGSSMQSYSKQGNLVCCTNIPNLFNFQAFDDFILEMNKPFTIRFNNYYLAQSKEQSESKTGIQQECIFVEKQTQACLWVIEQMK